MTKATLAREWLWFVGSLLAMLALIAVVWYSGAGYIDQNFIIPGGVLIYLMSGFVRLTWWAVHTVRKSN